MNKYFIVSLVCFLFLGACGSGKNPEGPNSSDSTAESDPDTNGRGRPHQEPVHQEPVAVSLPPAQESLSGDEIWLCKSGSEEVSYALNKDPTTIDDEGTPNARRRVCELFRSYKGNIELLKYAHWNGSHCETVLKEAIDSKGSEGWECSKN